MSEDAFTANDGWYAKPEEIEAAALMLFAWGGLREGHLSAEHIVAKMLVAAHNATHPMEGK